MKRDDAVARIEAAVRRVEPEHAEEILDCPRCLFIGHTRDFGRRVDVYVCDTGGDSPRSYRDHFLAARTADAEGTARNNHHAVSLLTQHPREARSSPREASIQFIGSASTIEAALKLYWARDAS